MATTPSGNPDIIVFYLLFIPEKAQHIVVYYQVITQTTHDLRPQAYYKKRGIGKRAENVFLIKRCELDYLSPRIYYFCCRKFCKYSFHINGKL